jgi:hypothetical protein
MLTDSPIAEPAVEAWPEYWIVVLLRAMRRSDLAAAAEAQHRLRELGIDVRFPDLLPEVASDD